MKPVLFCFLFAAIANGQTRRVDPPTAKESGMPYLTTDAAGVAYLSYIDYLGSDGHALRYVRWTGTQWSASEVIAQGKSWFVNWADFPTISASPDGTMLAHWLTRNQAGATTGYGYGIRVARRDAATKTWKEVYGMSLDEPKDYAGFLSFLPGLDGAVYLAPPKPSDPGDGHRKTVRFVRFSPAGQAMEDTEIDPDACSCCQTAVAPIPGGWIAAYRDHQPGEIRDISVIRSINGKRTTPMTLYPDRWEINGCPTDGPSISTNGKQVGIVWLTRAQNKPRIQIALSSNAGEHFNDPIRIDDGNPLGRASLTELDDRNYLAVWLEKTSDDGKAEVRLRRIARNGQTYPSITIAPAATGRNTGFPRVVATPDQVLVAWRDQTVRAAALAKKQILDTPGPK